MIQYYMNILFYYVVKDSTDMLAVDYILNCNVFVHKELWPFGNKSWSRHGLRDCAVVWQLVFSDF